MIRGGAGDGMRHECRDFGMDAIRSGGVHVLCLWLADGGMRVPGMHLSVCGKNVNNAGRTMNDFRESSWP